MQSPHAGRTVFRLALLKSLVTKSCLVVPLLLLYDTTKLVQHPVSIGSRRDIHHRHNNSREFSQQIKWPALHH